MGSHVLKIEGYSQTKRLRNGNAIKSQPFEIGGHRWCIMYYPNGCRKDDAGWISLYLRLKSGTHVKASYSFSLLDGAGEPITLGNSRGTVLIHTFKSGDRTWGFPKIIERNVLEQSNYLRGDCFSIRCDVTVSKKIRTEFTTQFVTVPPSDMSRHMGRLLSSGVGADVTFRVGDETFAAHRLVLGARSSVFMAELLGPMKEKGTSYVPIYDMEPRVFGAMLHFIYTDELPGMDKGDTIAMAQHLLVAADRYDLQRLKLMCEHKLCNCISSSMVSTTLALAEQHGCKGLKEACFQFLKSRDHLKKIMKSDEFQHLTSSCPSLRNELLANVGR